MSEEKAYVVGPRAVVYYYDGSIKQKHRFIEPLVGTGSEAEAKRAAMQKVNEIMNESPNITGVSVEYSFLDTHGNRHSSFVGAGDGAPKAWG